MKASFQITRPSLSEGNIVEPTISKCLVASLSVTAICTDLLARSSKREVCLIGEVFSLGWKGMPHPHREDWKYEKQTGKPEIQIPRIHIFSYFGKETVL